MEISETAGPIVSQTMRRRASVAGLDGGVIEYYDFTAYDFSATLGVFGADYLAKPLGGCRSCRVTDRCRRDVGLGMAHTVLGSDPAVHLLPCAASIHRVQAAAATVLGLAVLSTVRSHHTNQSGPVPGLDPGRTPAGRAK
jgi:hypothetical protein